MVTPRNLVKTITRSGAGIPGATKSFDYDNNGIKLLQDGCPDSLLEAGPRLQALVALGADA